MSIGKDPGEIDAEQPDEDAVLEALGFDDGNEPSSDESEQTDDVQEIGETDDLRGVVENLLHEVEYLKREREKDRQLISDLERDNERLRERVTELEDEQEKASRNRKDLAKRMTESLETAKESKEIAKSASAIAQQAKTTAESDGDAQDREDPQQLPGGVEPSSSPVDFLANCRQLRVKKHLVDNGTPRRNRWRALLVYKRWEEFATTRKDGSGVFWTKDDVREALTAILGERPHAQTLKRVWKEMQAIGGSDAELKRRKISSKQDAQEIVAMTMETAEGLLEARYHQLELLDADGQVTGGVTPVVTEPGTAEV